MLKTEADFVWVGAHPSRMAEVRRLGLVDHGWNFGNAKPGQRQRAAVLASFAIREDEKDWEYRDNDDLASGAYPERMYPSARNFFARLVGQSLTSFVRSLIKERRLALKIADEVRAEVCEDLTNNEIIDVVTRQMDFKQFAIRIGLHSEND